MLEEEITINTFDNRDEGLKKNGLPRKRLYRKLIGKMYGKLEVLEEAGYRGRNKLWKAKCHVCGTIKIVAGSQLRSYTKSCGCIRTQRDWNSANWKGVGEMSRERLGKIKTGARKRSKEYSLQDEYLWELFLKQERTCALSGLPLKFGNKGRDETTASLDRINNDLGYIEGNVQWVHKHINAMKLDHTEDYFIELCRLIVEYNKNENK